MSKSTTRSDYVRVRSSDGVRVQQVLVGQSTVRLDYVRVQSSDKGRVHHVWIPLEYSTFGLR